MASSHATLVFFTFIIACSSLSMAKDCRLGVTLVSRDQISNQTLRQLCDSQCYTYIVIRQDLHFRSPRLNFDSNGVADGITYCQNRNVKVLLSLTGPVCGETPFPPKLSASIVWELFLNPNGSMSTLYGNTKFDGIDFGFTNGSDDYYYKLAQGLKNYSSEIILSASPGCAYPSPYFKSAINAGLFNVIWPKFYNNRGCDYSGGIVGLETTWKKWDESIPNNTKLLIGVPTSPEGVESGYVEPGVFKTNVLSNIRFTEQYVGVMLWNFEPQVNSLYASQIAQESCDDTRPTKCHAGNIGSLISQVV